MPERMFETRSDAWEAVGLSVDVSQRAVKRARREAMVLFPIAIALVIAYDRRFGILGWSHNATATPRSRTRCRRRCRSRSHWRWW